MSHYHGGMWRPSLQPPLLTPTAQMKKFNRSLMLFASARRQAPQAPPLDTVS